MRLVYLLVFIVLSACQNRASTLSTAEINWCKEAGLQINSSQCINYVNTLHQRAQQDHLRELQRQGVPVQYDKCVQSLPINAVYKELSIKYGITEQEIRDFIPESTLNDFAECTCSDMLYGGAMPDEAIQKCQTKIASSFLGETKDTHLTLCTRTTINEIRQEYERQQVAFNEAEFKSKYSKNITNYCNCVFDAKENILEVYQAKTMPEKVQLTNKAAMNCAAQYLKL